MDSDKPLDLLVDGQAHLATAANEVIDSVSFIAVYGRRASTSLGLEWGYYGGRWDTFAINPGSLFLTASATNYLTASRSTGAITRSTSSTAWNDIENNVRLYLIITDAGSVVSYEDHRASRGGVVFTSSPLPATFQVASQVAMLATGALKGDLAVRADLQKTFALAVEPATILGNWVELLANPETLSATGGTIDDVVVGGDTPAAGHFTTLTTTGDTTVGGTLTASGDAVVDGTLTGNGAVALHSTLNVDGVFTAGTDAIIDGTLAVAGNVVKDSNGLATLKFSPTTAAVNEITLTNAATGNGVAVSATGTDSNVALKLGAKGSSNIEPQSSVDLAAHSLFLTETTLGSTTGTINIDWSAATHYIQPEPTGAIVYTFTAPTKPTYLHLRIDSDGASAAHTVAFPATVDQYGVAYTTTDTNKKAFLTLFFDGTRYHLTGGNQDAVPLYASKNLSDLTSTGTALTNLGFSANAQSFVAAANYAAMRTLLTLVPGTDVQAYDGTLAALAAANWALDAIPIGTGSDTLSQVTFASNTFPAKASTGNLVAKSITDFGLSLVAAANAAAGRTVLSLGTVATLASDTDGTLAANSDSNVATQKAVKTALDLKANLSSPTLTGTPLAPTAAASTNTTQIATTAFVQAAIAAGIAGLLNFKGSTDCSTNPNYPSAVKGDSYIVSVAGKIGGASGTVTGVGDWYICIADNAGGTEASVGASWGHLEHNLVGALLASNNLSDVADAATAVNNLGGAASTGSGGLVRKTNAALITPDLGTPSAIDLTNATGAPTWNQSTTGSAATLTTTRSIYGNNFNGSAALNQIIASTYGGTGNGFTKFTGPTTAERVFTLPDSSQTLLYSGGALGTPASGNLANCTFPTFNQNTSGSAASLSVSGQTGLITFTGLASTSRVKTVSDAADTILELGGSYSPGGTWTSMTMVTPILGTPTSGTLTNCTGLPAAGVVGTAATLSAANVFTTLQTITQASANTGIFASTGYSLTGSSAVPAWSLTGTLSTSGTPDVAVISITNTASNAASNLFNFKVGGSTVAKIDIAGSIRSNNFYGLSDPYNIRAVDATQAIVINNSNASGGIQYFKSITPQASALSTSMVAPFINIPGAAGVPTGVPSNTTGFPFYWDSTNLQLSVYSTAWKVLPNLTSAQTFTAAQRGAFSTLTDGATITPDFSLANQYIVALGGNRTLGVPTNIVAGQQGVIIVRQDTTGSRTLAYAWPYEWFGGTAGVLSTAGCTRDMLAYSVDAYNSGTVTITIASPGVVTMTNHGFITGQICQITTTGALPTGLTASTTYWISKVDANSFKLCTSLANAAAGTFINTSGSQSGTHTLTGCSITLSLSKAAA